MGRRQTLLLLLVLCAFASFVSAQSVTVTFLDEWGEETARVLEQGKALLRVIDPAADTSPDRDQVSVDLSSEIMQDGATVNLLETGSSTGVFEGEADLTTDFYLNYLEDTEHLLTQQRSYDPVSLDTATAAYNGASDSAEAAPSLTHLLDETGGSPSGFALGETVRVRVRDSYSNKNVGPETTLATLSLSGGDSESLILVETGGHTGVFEVSLPSGPGAPVPGDGRIQAAVGETISVVQSDANGFSSSSDSAAVTAASVRLIDREGRPTDLYLEDTEAIARVVHLAANLNSSAFETVTATVSMQLSGDVETLTLRETGWNTGVFEGAMPMSIGFQSSGNQRLDSQPVTSPPSAFDTVTVSYSGASDSAGLTGSVTRLFDEEGEEAGSFALGTTVRIRVEAADGSGFIDSTAVEVRSLATGDVEIVQLLETGPTSNVFEGTILVVWSAAPGPSDGYLQAVAGGTLRVDHFDANGYTRSRAEAAVVRSSVRFVDGAGRPVSVLLEGDTARIWVLDRMGQPTPPAASVESFLARDSEALSLTVVPGTTYLFEDSIPLSTEAYYGTPGDGVLTTSHNTTPVNQPDRVTATSNGASAEAVTSPAILEFVDDEGEPRPIAPAGALLRLRALAPKANLSPAYPNYLLVQVRSRRGGDYRNVYLNETGADTRTFEGTIGTRTGSVYDPDKLYVEPSDTVTALFDSYSEMSGAAATVAIVPVTVELLDGEGQAVSSYLFGETVHVRVTEPAANADPATAEVVSATVQAWRRSDDRPDVEAADLLETGPDTGVFSGSLPSALVHFLASPYFLNGSLELLDIYPPYGDLATVTATRGGVSDTALMEDSRLRITNSSGLETGIFPIFGRAHVRLQRPAGNTTAGIDTESVEVWTSGGDVETLSLAETGSDTGIFMGSIPVSQLSSTSWNGILEGQPGETGQVDKIVTVTLRSVATGILAQVLFGAPEAEDDFAATAESTPVTIDVIANDYDVDGDDLGVVAVTQGTKGTVSFTPGGATLTYTPNAGATGSDSFTYTVSDFGGVIDGNTDTATVFVTIDAVNDPPVAVDDSATTNEDAAVNFPVKTNDSDPDGDNLSVIAVTQGAKGSVVINQSPGAFEYLIYTPNANANGSDSFTYTVSDGHGGTDTATVSITITPVNDVPNAVDDVIATSEDTSITFDPRTNDTDVDGAPLTVTSASNPNRGSTVVNPDGTITYTPDANLSGTDLFVYSISDGQGGTDSALVTVTVAPVNDVPDARNDLPSTQEDNPVTISVLSNDVDADGHTLTVTAFTQPAKGTAVLNADKTITYTPNLNTNGSDSFTYTISDGNGGTDTATVSLSVIPVNDPPVAVADTATVIEEGTVTIPVAANDTDPENSALTLMSVTQGAHGTVTILTGNQVRYQPAANYSGPDTFTYTIRDPGNLTSTGTVSVTVTPINDPPVAVADSAATNEDTPVVIPVLANDIDVDGALSVSAVTQGANGAVTSNGITVTYAPAANFSGSDSFAYTVSDGNGGTATASVTISIAAVNDAPNAAPDSGATREGVPVIIAVLANDTDVEGSALTVTAVGAPGVLLPDNTVRYTPGANFTGLATFSYTVSDGQGGTSNGQVTVVVGEALERVAVLATNSAWLRTGSDVLSGDVIVNRAGTGPFLNGGVELGLGGSITTATGWDVEADSLTVAAGAVVSGDVSYNQLTNNGTINGAQRSPLALPVFSVLPPFLTSTPGSTTINVATNGTRTLAPGSYLDMVVGRKGTVTFTGGVYHFRSITVDREAKLLFSAASTVRVQQKLSTKNLTTVGPATGAPIDASSILFYVAGINGTSGALTATPKAVDIGTNNTVAVNLYAPNGTIWLQDGTQATGAFLGKDIDVGLNVQVTLDSAFSGGQ